MDTVLQLRNGDTVNNPTTDQLTQALTQLDNKEDSGFDLFLTARLNENDWFLLPLPDGSISLTILYSEPLGKAETHHIPSVSRDEVLELWLELQQGAEDKIRAYPWQTSA